MILPIAGLVVAVFGSWFFAGTETGIYTVSRLRLRHRTEQGLRAARTLTRLLDSPRSLICTTLIGNNLCVYAATMSTSLLLAHAIGWDKHGTKVEVATIVLLTPILFVLAEIYPKNVFRVRADRLMLLFARPLSLLRMILMPVWAVLIGAARLMEAVLGLGEGGRGSSFTRAGLSYFFTQGTLAGAISDEQKAMAENIMALEKRTVADAMVPIDRAIVVPRGASMEAFRAALIDRRHARLPVVNKGRADVIGVLNIYDVTDWTAEDVTSNMKDSFFLSAAAPIDEAIDSLLRNRVVLSIVKDERDTVVGIVTVKDLVGEVIGGLKPVDRENEKS